MTAPNRVRDLRVEKRMSVADLARMSGLTPRQINYVEAGESAPSLRSARAIADALGFDVDVVFPKAPAAR